MKRIDMTRERKIALKSILEAAKKHAETLPFGSKERTHLEYAIETFN